MIIVVDGYNVIKQLVGSQKESDRERTAFIIQLESYAAYKKHFVVIVFDGGPFEWPCTENHAGIQVVYSGARQTADDYIGAYLNKHKQKEILLVSSDGGLASYADSLGIPSLDSYNFYVLVQEAVIHNQKATYKKEQTHVRKTHEAIIKLHDDTTAEFDAYMQEASQQIPLKQSDKPPTQVELARNKLARKDKRLLKIFKKL